MQLFSRTLARLVAAAALAAAASVAFPTSPASAATCSSADGVSVVVDFHELGGGVRTACLPDGGGQRASDLFPAAGFPLTYVQRQPGFVCTVSGAPADTPCVNTPPADAYWGLWWSDGTSGSWTYATTGVGGLTVPDGGYVAFSWNGSSTRATPGASPAPHPTEPTPTTSPTHASPTATAHPSHSAGTGSASASADPTASATTPGATDPTGSASAKPGHGKSRSGSPTPSESPSTPEPTDDASDAAPVSADAADPGDGGLPAWVAPVVIAALFAGAGGAAVVRRRRGTSGP